jgi:aryl carrier-like protein
LVAFLSEIWQDVLGVAGIGPDDDFLAIGGHSLTALRIAARIRAELHVPIRVDAVFRAPTISQLAALLDGDTDDEG